jgi:hypothetical protein
MKVSVMLRTVNSGGQLTLGKQHSGRHFEVEELASGEIVLRPVCLVRVATALDRAKPARVLAFQIAEVERIVLPTREQCNARPK